MDGDGGTGLLLRHARGTWFLYRIRNGALVGSSNVGGLPEGSEHRLVAAPELTGDGRPDLVTRDARGAWSLHLMNGDTVTEHRLSLIHI